MKVIIAVFFGFIVDCIFGDPQFMPHPVRVMGWFISKGDKLFRKGVKAYDFFTGMLVSTFLIIFSFAVPYFILLILYRIHFLLGLTVEIFLCYQIFAAKALKDESMKVYYELEKGDMPKARKYLSQIVGRDTEDLDEEGISKAAVETVAENLSDGVIAPLTYMLIGGAAAGLAYKAINTLDSMIGYKNKKYEFFGKFAARLDDIANFIPARISALLMIIGSFICRMNTRQAIKIFIRDRYKHNSPNSAHTEAVCAGALEVALSGNNYYGGKLVEKPVIGDSLRKANKEDIKRANRLMYATSVIGLILGILIRSIFILVL